MSDLGRKAEATYGVHAVQGVVPLSRELLDRSADSEALAKYRAKRRAAQPGIREAFAALGELEKAGGLEGAILELHHPSGSRYFECSGCDWGGYEGEPPEWPCRTVKLVAERHSIDVSNMDLFDPDWKP